MAISSEIGSIEVQKLDPNATIPTRANSTVAGYDLYAQQDSSSTIINPKDLVIQSLIQFA